MAMTRENLRDAIKAGIASRSDIKDVTINSYLDLSQERIARQQNWREFENTSDIALTFTGTAATDKIIDISSLTNLRDIQDFVIENSTLSRRLEQKSPEEFDRLVPLPEQWATDAPRIYTLWETNKAIIYPVLDQSYTARIRWIAWPAAFTGDSAASELLRKDDMLIFLTLSFIFALVREEDQAGRFFNYYRNELKQAGKENDLLPDLRISPNFLAGEGLTGNAHLDHRFLTNPIY